MSELDLKSPVLQDMTDDEITRIKRVDTLAKTVRTAGWILGASAVVAHAAVVVFLIREEREFTAELVGTLLGSMFYALVTAAFVTLAGYVAGLLADMRLDLRESIVQSRRLAGR